MERLGVHTNPLDSEERVGTKHLMPAVDEGTHTALKKTKNKSWHQTPVRTLARATEMNKHLRLTAAVVCSTTCCEESVKNKCSSSWYVQLMSFFFSLFQLLLLSSVLWRNFLQPTCFYPLAVAHMFALRSLASTHNPSATRISSKNMNVWTSATEIILLAVLNCNWLVHTIPKLWIVNKIKETTS